jgi:pimeloyl-ACP methyl ester carboxylesterase
VLKFRKAKKKLSRVLVVCASFVLVACRSTTPIPPRWQKRFIEHDGVRIEYRVRAGSRTPVVFVPGMSNRAAQYEEDNRLVDALGDRTILAISIRGRGESSTPDTGWTVAAQASDIAAVVSAEKLQRYHLVAHSMGVGYALHHALEHPESIASFTAADYRPGLAEVSEEWVQNMESKPSIRGQLDRRIARRMLNEQRGEYAPDISKFLVPVLVILGTESSDRFVEDLWKPAPSSRVLWIAHGHDTFTSVAARAALVEHLRRNDH